jgi:hypothetical protein
MTDDAELARLNHPATVLSSGHGFSLRLHRTVPAVEGGPAAVRPIVGSRNQARRLSADGAPGWLAGRLLHARVSIKASLSEELAGLRNPNDSFLPLVGQHNDLNSTILYVENRVSLIALRKNDLMLLILGNSFPRPYLLQEDVGIEWIIWRGCQHAPPFTRCRAQNPFSGFAKGVANQAHRTATAQIIYMRQLEKGVPPEAVGGTPVFQTRTGGSSSVWNSQQRR